MPADPQPTVATAATGRAEPGGSTALVGVLGDPVRHSLSPAMHNAALAALGLDWVYLALPVAAADLATVVAALEALDCRGLNVTIPHKQAVAALKASALKHGTIDVFNQKKGRLPTFQLFVLDFERRCTASDKPWMGRGPFDWSRFIHEDDAKKEVDNGMKNKWMGTTDYFVFHTTNRLKSKCRRRCRCGTMLWFQTRIARVEKGMRCS